MMIKDGTAALAFSAALVALVAAPPIYAQGKGNESGGSQSASQPQRGNAGGQGAGNKGAGSSGTQNAGKNDRAGPPAENRNPANRGGSNDVSPRGNANEAASAGNARGNAGKTTPIIGRDDNARGNRGSSNSAKGNQGANDGVRGIPAINRGGSGRIEGADGLAFREIRETFGTRPRMIDGCPPGLAKKRNGCLPPGQARDRYRSFEPGFFGLNGAERGQYLYEDGYLLRYRPDGLAGFLPLLGGALGIGNTWPVSYQSQALPAYYSDFSRLGEPRNYRYADNVMYRVNPETNAITSIAGLLTGNEIEIGRPMPRGYDVYNVPFAHREQYSDSPQARYRYADGYIYEIDPKSALVASAIALVL